MNGKFSETGQENTGQLLPVVAIGASAGGMEAFQKILEHLSPRTGMAYVYVQHLDPTHKSALTEILGRCTEMKVVEADELMPMEPNTVYIIPRNKEMTIAGGALTLAPRNKIKGKHMPVDSFFLSLAENHRQGAIGIVLSGAADDGTIGLKAIKTAGGITIAQDDTAQFRSMPRAAISEGVVDLVLAPEEIAKELERLSKQAGIISEVMQDNIQQIEINDENLQRIIQVIKKNIGVDFTHYKINTVKRRIVRRMLLHRLHSLDQYLALLKDNKKEVTSLYQDLLINVTSFFRDPDTLEYLKKIIVPQILKAKAPNEPIRIWVPACSTGEEAYSIAMIFMEVLGTRAATTPLQIFATDISELMITKARLGVYTKNDVANVSPKRLQLFFSKIDGSYRIVKTIRDICVFAPHNIFRDPPFSRIDLLSCCNLMIYLDPVLQKKILSTFHYALNPHGFLVLGKSENIAGSSQLFALIEKTFRVFSRRNEVNSRGFFELNYSYADVRKEVAQARPGKRKEPENVDLDRQVDDLLLQKYVPASVIVNQDLDILQFRGTTGVFLEPMPGRASLNLLKMARPGLAFELKSIVLKAQKSGELAKKSGIDFLINDIPHSVSLEALPLKTESEEKLFMVVFEKTSLAELIELKSKHSKDELVRKLEQELHGVREDMRSIIEEQQASNEELQSANEEIVSSNEELQSINEELETSKEELESSNEELMTINSELQIRNEQLAEAYEYAEAVFGTIREAIVVLDRDRRVKTANQAFYRIFKLTEEETEGLLIYEVANRSWDIPEIRDLLDKHLVKHKSYDDLKVKWNFPKVGPKILLVNGCRVDQKIHQQQLFLLAIEDISELKNKITDDL
jgi:two-component system, chemotaxis family, CheB/CheR fusion protein